MRAMFRPRDLVFLSAGIVSLVLNAADFDLQDADFRIFYDSAAAWRSGGVVYPTSFRANLNPPWFPMLLSPLAALSMAGAFAVWSLINLVLAFSTARLILARRPELPVAWLMLALILTPAWYGWRHGQVVWILFALVTRGWLARSEVHAGLWLRRPSCSSHRWR